MSTDFSLYEGQGQVGALFGMHLLDIIDEHPELRILTADMSYIAKLERFKAYYPDQFINMGIAEQNMIGVAAGLSSEGLKCVCLAQATFITMRCFEQVRQYMSYMGSPIILIGLAAGFGLQFMGNTHYSIEDIGLMKNIPGMVVMSPADASEAVMAFDEALKINRPTYIRLTGDNSTPLTYLSDFGYSFNKANVVKEGEDIVIFATGALLAKTIDAAQMVESAIHKSVRVADVHTISPLDSKAIDAAKNAHLLVSVEEHNINGGLGSSIADYIGVVSDFPPLLKLGVRGYSQVGDYEFLLQQHRLTPGMIAEDIINRYNTL